MTCKKLDKIQYLNTEITKSIIDKEIFLRHNEVSFTLIIFLLVQNFSFFLLTAEVGKVHLIHNVLFGREKRTLGADCKLNNSYVIHIKV